MRSDQIPYDRTLIGDRTNGLFSISHWN